MATLDRYFGLRRFFLNGVEKVFTQALDFSGDGWALEEGLDSKNRPVQRVTFTPPTPGGGGPGYGIVYVYAVAGYVPADTPDGSAAKPFVTFTEAHDALPAAGGTIYVLASDGSSDASGIAFTKPLAVIADSPQMWGDGAHSVTSSAALYVENMTVTTDEGGQPGALTAAGITAKNCTAAFHSSAGLDLDGCTAQGFSTLVVTGSARLRHCAVVSNFTCGGALDATDCVIQANLSVGDVEARFSACRWTAGTRALTFTGSAGVMFVDAMSNYWWKAATETLTNGTKTIQADIL